MPRPISAQLLRDMTTGFRTNFRSAFAGAQPQYLAIATVVNSTTRTEKYTWLGKWPKIREWVGDRVVNRLAAHDYSVSNKRFETTVEVDADDVRDDQLGVYGPMMSEQGRATAMFPDELVFDLLANGHIAKCYDGQPFFDDEHPVANGVASNVTAGAGAPWFLMDTTRALKPLIFQNREAFDLVALDNPDDPNVFNRNAFVYGSTGRCNAGFGFWQMAHRSQADLDAAGYEAARAAMMSLEDDSGRKLGVKPNLLVCPASQEGAARRLLKAELKAGGATNEWAGTAEPMVALQL